MKKFTVLQQQLLALLCPEHCLSGSVIAKQLSVSRTTIWKQISQLANLGLDIKRISRQGYQLSHPFTALNILSIQHYLNQLDYHNAVDLHLFAEIDSTNRYLKDLAKSPITTICCAETQTQGRGRFSRQWHSPFGNNIYFSGRWQLNCGLSKLSGLSLIVSLAILTSLQYHNIQQDIRLKWPNDLIWQDKKLAGILIEVLAETNNSVQIIIGVGINVNSDSKHNSLLDTSWCSLQEITGRHFDRNYLIATLIKTLNLYINQFLQQGFQFFHADWQQVDYLDGRYITLFQPHTSLSGYVCGVDEQGQLCLIDDQGKYHYLASGDTSLKNSDR